MSLSHRFNSRALVTLVSLGTATLALAETQAETHGLAHGSLTSAVTVNAILQRHDSTTDATALSWWLGAFTGSVLVSGSSCLVLRRLPLHWTARLAVVLALVGGVVALGPLGLLVR